MVAGAALGVSAASLVGFDAPATAGLLTEDGDRELADARQLIEKIIAVGGSPTTERQIDFLERSRSSP
jgi:hypothetical protein